MIPRKIKNGFKDLPLYDKILGISILLSCLSVFLPWYKENDLWGGNPEQYLGITGPLYLIGTIILLISLYSSYIFLFSFLQRRIYHIFKHKELYYVIAGCLILFFDLLSYSIYFHNKFGVNILTKEARFGMIISFISASLMVIAGYLKYVQSLKEIHTYALPADFQDMNMHTPHAGLSDRLRLKNSSPATSQGKVVQEQTEGKKIINLRMDI